MGSLNPLSEEELVAAVDADLAVARQQRDASVGYERGLAYDYYHGRPFGNEEEGRSQVVSQLVMEVVDTLMPDLMRIFCGGEKVVEFSPRKQEDVALAASMTDVANYVLFSQNDGFRIVYEGVKDALLQKTGVFKYWWEEEQQVSEETFAAVSIPQIQAMIEDGGEIVNASPSPQQPPMGMGGAPMQGPQVGIESPAAAPTGGLESPQPMLFDVTVRKVVSSGKVRIACIPPDQFLVAGATSVSVQDLPMCAHEVRVTLAELVKMGLVTAEEALELPSGDTDSVISDIESKRDERTDEPSDDSRVDSSDLMARRVLFVESYKRIDADGDGVAELRQISKVGDRVLVNRVVDHIPFAVCTPKIMPHEFYGVSLADDVLDLQLLKSTLWRLQLDGLYLSLYPRQQVVEGMASPNTYPDLLAPGPGRMVRVKAPGAVTPMDVPYAGNSAMPMLEFIEQELEGRTPVSRQYQGLPDSAINKTATSARISSSRSQGRVEMIARIIAETGLRDLFKGILWLLGQHQTEGMIVRVSGGHQYVDPQAWKTEYDMTINVGLGLGNKAEQMQALSMIAQAQAMAAQSGMIGVLVTPKNLYDLQTKIANLAGFKEPFWTQPPDDWQPPQPQPPYQVEVAKMALAAKQEEAQAKLAAEQEKAVREEMAERRAHEEKMLAMRYEAEANERQHQQALELQRSNDERQMLLDQRQHEQTLEAMEREHQLKAAESLREFELKERIEMAKLNMKQADIVHTIIKGEQTPPTGVPGE